MSDVVHPVLFDVDNTLLDNDRIAADLRRYLTREVGAERRSATGRSSSSSAANSGMRILTAVKRLWGDRVTTVFPRHGHYAPRCRRRDRVYRRVAPLRRRHTGEEET